jgi:PKD repeat protein
MFKIYTLLFLSIFYFNAHSQTVDFTYVNSQGGTALCSPVTLNFTPVCTGNPIGYTWYFSNSPISNSAIPSVAYAAAGSYTVKLVAVFQNLALEITKTIVISPPVTVTLNATPSYLCKLDSVTFNCTTNATNPSFLYDFRDLSAPITTTSNIYTHYYGSYNTFYAKVTVTNASGCSDTAATLITVKKISVTGFPITGGGCAPFTNTLTCTPIIPAGSSVTNFNWTFGDLTSNTNGGNPITHTYLDSGSFYPNVIITTSQGCKDTFAYPLIKVGKTPTMINAYPDKFVYCGSETPKFVGTSDFANEYKWEFGEPNTPPVTTPDTLIFHKYTTLGPKVVKVTPYFNGCAGTPRSFTINIIGVIANYYYSNTCAQKKTFTFANLTQVSLGSVANYIWDFGDGSALVNATNPVHTFPQVGTFYTMLKAVDNVTGCRDSITFPILTANPSLINADTFVCRNASTTFSVLNNYSGAVGIQMNALGQTLFLGGGDSQLFVANTFGNFNTHIAILDLGQQYCKDTLTLNKLISVRGPSLSYNTGTSFCTNNNFIINNTSFPFAASDTIKNWRWTFGIAGLIDTGFQPAPFIYSAEGTYVIELTAKDKKGCTDTLQKTILVKESPFLRIFPRTQTICQGATVTLTAYHTDTLVWAPANLVACATCDTTIATPIVTTNIYAIASNAVGCSLRDSSIIKVYNPFTATATPNTFFACKNDTVGISGILPLGKKILWSTNYGLNNTTTYTPIATVLGDTSYSVLLTDSANCYNSTTTVNVKLNPPASVNVGPDRTLSYNSPFTLNPAYSPAVTTYLWTPAGNLNCTNCATPTGLADKPQTFVITASTDKKCVAKDTINIFIECAYANLFMASAFSPTNISVNKYYFPQTRGIKKINRFSIYNRYGEIVYEVKNASPNIRGLGWDGKYKGILQESGGFVYVLEAVCEQGELLNKQGTFLLVR